MGGVVQDAHRARRRMGIVSVARSARLGNPDRIALQRLQEDQRQLVPGTEHVAECRDFDLVLGRLVGCYWLDAGVRVTRPDQSPSDSLLPGRSSRRPTSSRK